MCFYLYAPNRKIDVLYKSEFIKLAPDATSIVGTDILIQDPDPPDPLDSQDGREPIKEFFIIYPNRLYTPKKNKDVLGKRVFFFSDATETFSDKSANRIYDLYRNRISPSPLYQTTPTWATYLGLQIKTPSDPEQTLTFEGFIRNSQDNDKNLVIDDLTYEQKVLLDVLNFTILRYELDIPLGKHARWIRLGFKGKKSAKTSIFAKRTRLMKFTNSLIYYYHILGPSNVKDKFESKLLSASESPDNPAMKSAAERLISRFKREGLIREGLIRGQHTEAETTFHNVFTRVSPTKMEQIFEIKEENIDREFPSPEHMLLDQKKYKVLYRLAKLVFSFPKAEDIKCHYNVYYRFKKKVYNFLSKSIPPRLRKKEEISEQLYMTIYKWRHQENNPSSLKDPVGYFSITFEAKPFNLKYLLIGIIALTASLTIGGVNFCENHRPTIFNDLEKNIKSISKKITTTASDEANPKTEKLPKK